MAAVRQANFNFITDPVTVPDHDILPYPDELKQRNKSLKYLNNILKAGDVSL